MNTMTFINSASLVPDYLVSLRMTVPITPSSPSGNATGTGFFISQTHILSAAHNIFNAFGVLDASTVTVIPQRLDNPSGPFGQTLAVSYDDLGNSYNPSGTTTFANSDFSDDISILSIVPSPAMVSGIINGTLSPANLVFFQNANDAVNAVQSVTVYGYTSNTNTTGFIQLAMDTGTISSVSTTLGGPVYNMSASIDTDIGISGGPYFFDVSLNGNSFSGVGAVHAGETSSAHAAPLTFENYSSIASILSSNMVSSVEMGTIALVMDQSGGGVLNGTYLDETIYSSSGDDFINSGGGNDVIFASNGNDTIDGGLGLPSFFGFREIDVVDYSNLNSSISIDLNSDYSAIVTKSGMNGTDRLTDIEHLKGTAFADTFILTALNSTVFLEGLSNVPTQFPAAPRATDKSADAALTPQRMFPNGTEDTIIIDQALLDAGAQVTYLTDTGEGVVWLGDNKLTYTGIFNEAQQTSFFGALDNGASVGLDDVGGIVLDFSASTVAVTDTVLSAINLFDLVDDFVGSDLGDVIDLGLTGLTDYAGGAADDDVTGTADGNALSGGAGNDTLSGMDGEDVLIGGVGDDDLSGGDDSDSLSGEAGDDSLSGGAAGDVLSGGDGNDTLDGGAGNDLLTGGAGADIFIGGAGGDRAIYDTSDAGVSVNLLTGSASGGDAAGDSFVSIESLVGSAYNDVLTGNDGNNRIDAGAGNDVLRGNGGSDFLLGEGGNDLIFGSAGGDIISGGSGADTVRYVSSDAGVSVSLLAGTGVGGHADGDSISQIEGVHGSQFADVITGDGRANNLNGFAGDDVIDGGGGNDRLYGQSGSDRFIYGENYGSDIVADFEIGIDIFDISALSQAAIADVLSGMFQSGDNVRYIDGNNGFTILDVDLAAFTGDIDTGAAG